MYTQANREAYDVMAPEYLERAQDTAELNVGLADVALRHARAVFTDIDALEIGPGSGVVSRHFAQEGCQSTALDISPRILRNVALISPDSERIEADILHYKLPADTYNLIYAGAVVHLFTLNGCTKSDGKHVSKPGAWWNIICEHYDP